MRATGCRELADRPNMSESPIIATDSGIWCKNAEPLSKFVVSILTTEEPHQDTVGHTQGLQRVGEC